MLGDPCGLKSRSRMSVAGWRRSESIGYSARFTLRDGYQSRLTVFFYGQTASLEWWSTGRWVVRYRALAVLTGSARILFDLVKNK